MKQLIYFIMMSLCFCQEIELGFTNFNMQTGSAEINLLSSEPSLGFQLNITGVQLTEIHSPYLQELGFNIEFNPSSNLIFVWSFSGIIIPPMDGSLLSFSFSEISEYELCFQLPLFSDSNSPPGYLDVEHNCLQLIGPDEGCTDPEACNTFENASYPCFGDNSCCSYPEPYYDCNGNCLLDENNNNICDHGEEGCLDPLADNYNQYAQYDNGICTYSMDLNLYSGNNLISFHGQPELFSTVDLLTNLEEVHGVTVHFIITEGTGLFQIDENEDGILDNWTGNLHQVDPYSGYWINVDSSVNWNVLLEEFSDPCMVYSLNSGNNLVSFNGANGMPTLEALDDFIGNINFITGQGLGLFNVENEWAGNLNNLENGKGYWINSTIPIEDFTFGSECSLDGLLPANENFDYFKEIHPEYRFIQSTEQAFYLVKDIPEVEEGDLILAYCNDNLVGSVEWIGEYTPIPVMGKDTSPQTEGYCEVGDVPSFFWNRENGERRMELIGDIPGFENLGVYTLEKLALEIRSVPSEFLLQPAYPNPFNPVTTIFFGVPDVEAWRAMSLHVYNINGRLIETLLYEHVKPGIHSVKWDASEQPSGVYLIQLEGYDVRSGNTYTESQKVILMK